MNWWRRLRQPDELERHLDAELRDHVDRQVADYVAAGMSGDDARRRARLEFGGLDQVKESLSRCSRNPMGRRSRTGPSICRSAAVERPLVHAGDDRRAGPWHRHQQHDVHDCERHDSRPADRQPRAVSCPSTRVMARVIGGGSACLILISWTFARPRRRSPVSRRLVQTTTTLGDNERAPERASAAYLSANAFQLLGEKPMLGRDFLPEDDQPGAPAVVILGSPIWKARYNADPTLIGRTIRINGVPTIVIGVMPDGFRFPCHQRRVATARAPAADSPIRNETRAGSRCLASSPIEARQRRRNRRSKPIAARLSRDYPDTNRNIGAVVAAVSWPFRSRSHPDCPDGAVGFVLLVACANVANLSAGALGSSLA